MILCTEAGGKISPRDEESITARIDELLGEKGVILWWRGSTKTKRSFLTSSQSLPPPADSVKTTVPTKKELSSHVERPINPKEFTLVLKTRLRRGKILYDKSDKRLEGWTACQEMEDNLLREWQSTNMAELLVFRENKTGNERTVVYKDFETRIRGSGESVKDFLESFGLITRTGGSVTGTSVTSAVTSSSVTGLANTGAQVIGAGVSGLANAGVQVIGTGANVVSTGVAGFANIGVKVVGTGLSTIGSILSSSDSRPEDGSNSSTGDYDLNLDTD